jgi:TPR repeat protein
MRGNKHLQATLLLLTSVVALSVATIGAARSASMAVLLPPDLDYAQHCAVRTIVLPVLDRDWTTWQGEPAATPADQLVELAGEYLRGSDRVTKSAPTALRILDYVDRADVADRAKLDRLIGRTLVEAASSEADLKAAEARLQRALAAGETRAALDLAKLYGPGGPATMSDAARARTLAQAAAASGDVAAKQLFASILASDPSVPAEQKAYTTEAALLAMIGEVVAGNCGYLKTIGQLYLHGQMVDEDVPTAIAWLEQFAETGDAATLEQLGNLIAGPRLSVNDFQRALDYSEAAANKGRIGAAVTVGRAYATGLIRTRDLDKAKHYLGMAAEGGSRDANLWLARIANGGFGAAPDWQAVKRYYRAAIAQGAPDQNLQTEFGSFLVAGSDPTDLVEARELLTQAAMGGSGQAAALVAELLLTDARKDPSIYPQVETFFRLAAEFGRPEAARRMADLSLCGGPLFSPGKAEHWRIRAKALGADSLMFADGLVLVTSSDPVARASGQAMIRDAAELGEANAIGYVLAQQASGGGTLPSDPELAARLQSFVDRSTDVDLIRKAAFARIEADLDAGATTASVDAAIAELDTFIAEGVPQAMMLKAEIMEDFRGATAAERLPLLQAAAEAGFSKAMRELGFAMLDDPSADIATARVWLEKAAATGDVKAALRLIDTTTDTAMAALQSIAQSGTVCSVDIMVTLARTYAATIDPAAPAEAARWLEVATTAAGDRAADLVRIARAYDSGVAGPDAVSLAEPLLARAMQLGDPDAAMVLAEGHLKGRWPDANADVAQQLLAGLAADGNGKAAATLLHAIADGNVEAPATQVALLAQQSGDHLDDNGRTFAKLARLDEDGAFGSPDPERRIQWLQQAADAGDAGAMMRLYRTYAAGIGVPASADLAIGWLHRAAEIGDTRAAKELAAAYTVGFGTEADPERAAFWRARAEVTN